MADMSGTGMEGIRRKKKDLLDLRYHFRPPLDYLYNPNVSVAYSPLSLPASGKPIDQPRMVHERPLVDDGNSLQYVTSTLASSPGSPQETSIASPPPPPPPATAAAAAAGAPAPANLLRFIAPTLSRSASNSLLINPSLSFLLSLIWNL